LFGLPFVVKFVPIYSFSLEQDCYDGKEKTRPNTNSMGKRHFRLALKPVTSNARPFIPALSSLRERKRDVEFNLMVLGTTGALGSADLEAVLEATVDILEVAHSAGAGGLSSLGLLTPVVLANLSGGVTAVGTGRLLDVEGAAATTPAEGVRLVVALAEAGGTLRHLELRNWRFR
jgi:hypothetical protein